MKTLTVERYHIYGTRNSYDYALSYRGKIRDLLPEFDTLSGEDMMKSIMRRAKREGFTHVKYTGVWRDGRQGRTEPIA